MNLYRMTSFQPGQEVYFCVEELSVCRGQERHTSTPPFRQTLGPVQEAPVLSEKGPNGGRVKVPLLDPVIAEKGEQLEFVERNDFNCIRRDHIPHGKICTSMLQERTVVGETPLGYHHMNDLLQHRVAWLVREHKDAPKTARDNRVDPCIEYGLLAGQHPKLISLSALDERYRSTARV